MKFLGNATLADRPIVTPAIDPKAEPYRDRLKLARCAASCGLGREDLEVTFNISESDARRIVFGRDE